MWKRWIAALFMTGIGYSFYAFYTGPFYSAPTINDDDFLLAFDGEGALRGVMRGFGDKDKTRRYLSYRANDVPTWYQDTWSNCRRPSSDEAAAFEREVNMGPGGRYEAVCEIDADDDIFVRGWIVSVPNL
jgi:hypothetical protein